MSKSFTHGLDGVFRVGDYVKTVDVTSGPEAERASSSMRLRAHSSMGNVHTRSNIGGSSPLPYDIPRNAFSFNLHRATTPLDVCSRIDTGKSKLRDKNSRQKNTAPSLHGTQKLHSSHASSAGKGLGGTGAFDEFGVLNASLPGRPHSFADEFGPDMSFNAYMRAVNKSLGIHEAHESEQGSVVGIVKEVGELNAKVTVWMRGGEPQVGKRKPVEALPLASLCKISQQEFFVTCKRPCMHDINYQLKLKGEGYDESAPMALIAYNNRVISSLIDKMITRTQKPAVSSLPAGGVSDVHGTSSALSGNVSASKRSGLTTPIQMEPRRWLGGVGRVKNMPTPTVLPIEDPLADCREELHALASDGTTTSKKRKVTKEHKTTEKNAREEEEFRDTRGLSSRLGCRSGSFAPQAVASAASAVEELLVQEGVSAQRRISEQLLHSRQLMIEEVRATLPPDMNFTPPDNAPESPAMTRLARDTTAATAEFLTCAIADVMDDGRLYFKPRNDVRPFVAGLRYVMLYRKPQSGFFTTTANVGGTSTKSPRATTEKGAVARESPDDDRDGLDLLKSLIGQSVEVKSIAKTPQLTCIVTLMETGDTLQETLVSLGLGYLFLEAMENVSSVFGSAVAQALGVQTQQQQQQPVSPVHQEQQQAQEQDIVRLQRAQQSAMLQRVGMWSKPLSHVSFLPIEDYVTAAFGAQSSVAPGGGTSATGQQQQQQPSQPLEAPGMAGALAPTQSAFAPGSSMSASSIQFNLASAPAPVQGAASGPSRKVPMSSKDGGTAMLLMDSFVEEDEPLPPLFTAMESTSMFRTKLLRDIQQGRT